MDQVEYESKFSLIFKIVSKTTEEQHIIISINEELLHCRIEKKKLPLNFQKFKVNKSLITSINPCHLFVVL